MNKQRQQLAIVLSAMVVAMVAVVSLVFVVGSLVHAADPVIGELNAPEHFVISGTTLTGLSASGKSIADSCDELHITIPDGVTSLDCSSSWNITKLSSIEVPVSLINFQGGYSFREATKLTSVNYLGTIDQWLQINFNGTFSSPFCSRIAKLFIQGEELSGLIKLNTIKTNIFFNVKNNFSVECTEDVTSIGNNAFNNSGLTGIDLSQSSVTTVGNNAFADCNLSKLELPATVTTIGNGLFWNANINCIDLSQTEITEIPKNCFQQCKATYVLMPAKVTSIGANAFNTGDISMCIFQNAAVMNNYKSRDDFSSMYKSRSTYPIGLQINLTDPNGQQSIYSEKRLAGANFADWYYENGEWVQNADHTAATLPELPTGYVWQDDVGNELTTASLQQTITDAQAAGELVTINATAVEKAQPPVEITAPTADTRAFVYNGAAQTYAPVGFDDSTMTIANQTRTDAGTQTVTVTLKGNAVFAGTDQNSMDFTFTIAPAPMTAGATGGDAIYNGQPQPTVIQGTVNLCAGATAADQASIHWEYSYDSTHWQDTMPTMINAATMTIYYRVTAQNHTEATGTVTARVNPQTVSVPAADTTSYVYTGAAQTYQIAASDLYTVTNNVQTAVGTYHVSVALSNPQNYVWADGGTDALDYIFTIHAAPFSGDLAYTAYNGVYDGQVHDAIAITSPANDGSPYTWTFSTDGTTYTATMPQYTAVGHYPIYFKLSADGQEDYVDTCTVVITKAPLTVTIPAQDVMQKTAPVWGVPTVTGLVAGDDAADVIELYCPTYDAASAAVGSTHNILARVQSAYSGNYEIAQMNPGQLTVVKNPDLPEAPDNPDNPDVPEKPQINAPTANPQVFTYNGQTQIYRPVGFNAATMEIINNTRTNVGSQTVTVRLKDAANVFADTQTNAVEFTFTIQSAEIIVRKNSNAWFDERVDGELVGDLSISFLDKDTNGNYKYIVTGDDARLNILFKNKLYAVGEDDASGDSYDTTVAPLINKNTAAGRYEIYYQITDPSGNHLVKEGVWRIEIAGKDEYVIVIFNKPFTVTYGMDYVNQLKAKIFDPEAAYITVYTFTDGFKQVMPLEQFAALVDVNVTAKYPNQYGFQNIGKYDIEFTYKATAEESRTLIYRESNLDFNTNEDMLTIKPAELGVNWGTMEYTYRDGATYDIVAELTGHKMFVESDDLQLKFVIRTVNGQIIDQITAPGSYQIEAMLVDNLGNFVIADASRSRIMVVSEPASGFLGIPWLIWIIVGAVAALFVILLLLIIFLRKSSMHAKQGV